MYTLIMVKFDMEEDTTPGVKVLNLILIGEGVAPEPPPQISKFCRCGMSA